MQHVERSLNSNRAWTSGAHLVRMHVYGLQETKHSHGPLGYQDSYILRVYTRHASLLEALHEVLQVFWRHVDARLAHLINH